jgi:anthranilate synthase component I
MDLAGDMDTCIALRTIVWKQGTYDVQAGAGVVADSVPASEYEETLSKAKAMLKAVEIAEKGF